LNWDERIGDRWAVPLARPFPLTAYLKGDRGEVEPHRDVPLIDVDAQHSSTNWYLPA
jgi:hypothetical protein